MKNFNKKLVAATLIAATIANPTFVNAESFADTTKGNNIEIDFAPENEDVFEAALEIDYDFFATFIYADLIEKNLEVEDWMSEDFYFKEEEELVAEPVEFFYETAEEMLDVELVDAFYTSLEEDLNVEFAEPIYFNLEEDLVVEPAEAFYTSNEESLPVELWMFDVDYMKK